MEKIKLSVKFEKKFFYTKIIFILTLSYFLYLSFRQVLFFSESNLFFFIIFFLFQIIFIFIIFKKNYLFFNLFFLIFLNIIFTPVFFHYSFDVPYRYPNTKEVLEYDENYHHGLFKGVHTISRDERGNRVNKSINYKNKNNKTFRILAIGASTTEQEGLGDNYIWSNKLVRKLKENKIGNYDNYEIINFGIGGVRAIHNYFTIERNLNLEPDLVIFLLCINDWNNHIVNREINYIFPYIETYFNFENHSQFIKKSNFCQ